MKQRIVVRQEFNQMAVGLYMIQEYGDHTYLFGEFRNDKWVFEGEPSKEGFLPKDVKAFATIPFEMVTEFIDQLQGLGFTPSNAAAQMGELKATRSHLEDMRRIVFKENT